MKVSPSSVRVMESVVSQAIPAAAHETSAVTSVVRSGVEGLEGARAGVEHLRIAIFKSGSHPEPSDCTRRVYDALQRKGVQTLWLDADKTSYVGNTLMHDGAPVGQLDAIVPRYTNEHARNMLDQMEAHGIQMTNNRQAIETTRSKINTELAYQANGAPSIPTRFARSADDADASLRGLPDDIVVKPFDGESGQGVEFFTSHADAKAHINTHFAGSETALIVQPRVSGAMVRWTTEDGRQVESAMDYRVLIALDRNDQPQVHAILQRIGAEGSGKSNIDAGGWGQLVDVKDAPEGLIDAALKGFTAIPGKFGSGGVDIMPVGRSIEQPLTNHTATSWVVTETNSSPGITDWRGTHFADAMADRAIELAQRSYARIGSASAA